MPELAPQLVTERLLLRGWRASDLDAFAEMSADEQVMRHLGGSADRAQSWRAMALHVGHWALRGHGNWVVERRADGALLGRCGLWRPEGWPGLELGWVFARHAWGHGYAAEAARAAIDWAWDVLGAPRLISLIDPANAPSIRLAERLGFEAIGREVVGGRLVIVFGLAR